MNINILIVDDIEANLISLEFLLKEYFTNINIIQASNGEDALKITYTKKIDLIILDIQMPNMDGFEVAKYLKSNQKTSSIPIIFLTAAFKEEEFKERGFEIGAVDYLTKPINNHHLVNKLKLYIEIFEKQYKLKESLNNFKSLFENSLEMVVITQDDIIIDINKTALEKLNYTKSEIIGKYAKDFITKKYHSILEQNKHLDIIKSYEVELIKKDKSTIFAIANTKTIYKDNIKQRLTTLIDITELKEKDKIIQQQAKMASLGEVIENIAHQWRQPLSIISTIATATKMELEMGISQENNIIDKCDTINNTAQYLSRTIDDLQDFIKGDMVLKEISTIEIFENFYKIVKPSINNYNITLIKNIEDSIIKTYPNELNQCLLNIFNNSKDVLQNKDEKIFKIEFKINNNYLIISTYDNGGGIPEEIIDKIFEPYFTTKHKSQGTGIGLNMTYNIITEGFKGSIIAKNNYFLYKNKKYYGANFIIKVPI